jgi:mono/diheme cytochrome c family protein
VCPAPRGIAFDEPAGALQAQVLTVDAQGVITDRFAQPVFQMFGQVFEPAVAWRMVGLPTGGAVMVHQRAMTTPVVIEDDGYASGGCDNSIVHGAVSTVGTAVSQGTPGIASAAIPFSVLPVDLAVSAGGDKLALVTAGTGEVILTSSSLTTGNDFPGEGTCSNGEQRLPVPGEPTAVAFAGDRVVVQTREPASIVVLNGATIALPGESRADSGHEMFHHNPGGISSLACASCHPEGGQDGRTWNFDPIGPRRTQSLEGGILGTAPFHWDGDMTGLETIMGEVFERRMGGMHQSPRRVRAFARWIDQLPALPASEVADPAAAERGEALFNDATVACASCHSGSALTNNQSHDVGTGKAFQVPSLLGVAARAPFMHDGCAPTLKDRFSGYCGGGEQHGKTAHLSDAQINDLVAYLESL